MMSTQTFLVVGATGKTGHYTVQHLLERGHAVSAMVHKEDERAEALRGRGAEVVIGELLEHDDVIRPTAGTSAAYFCYPVSPGLIPATAYFADAAKRAALKAVVNMSQISAREDSKSHAARDHWIAERLFDWSGVPTVHIRPTPCGVARAHSSTQEMEAMMRQSDNVPGTEKMDYEAWSALLRPLYGRHSLEGGELNTFSGWLRRLSVSGLTAVDICCDAHRFERTHRDVRLDNRDHYKAVFQVAGRSTIYQN